MNTDMDMDIDINTVTDTITCRLVEARADLGITQKELASATGISLKTIANIESKQHIPSLLYAMRIADFFLKPVTSLSSNSMDTTAGRFPVITISTTGCCFRKTQRHRTRNGAMPLCLFWHSFLVSAGYLPNTVFLIIKICWLNFFKFCYFIR